MAAGGQIRSVETDGGAAESAQLLPMMGGVARLSPSIFIRF